MVVHTHPVRAWHSIAIALIVLVVHIPIYVTIQKTTNESLHPLIFPLVGHLIIRLAATFLTPLPASGIDDPLRRTEYHFRQAHTLFLVSWGVTATYLFVGLSHGLIPFEINDIMLENAIASLTWADAVSVSKAALVALTLLFLNTIFLLVNRVMIGRAEFRASEEPTLRDNDTTDIYAPFFFVLAAFSFSISMMCNTTIILNGKEDSLIDIVSAGKYSFNEFYVFIVAAVYLPFVADRARIDLLKNPAATFRGAIARVFFHLLSTILAPVFWVRHLLSGEKLDVMAAVLLRIAQIIVVFVAAIASLCLATGLFDLATIDRSLRFINPLVLVVLAIAGLLLLLGFLNEFGLSLHYKGRPIAKIGKTSILRALWG